MAETDVTNLVIEDSVEHTVIVPAQVITKTVKYNPSTFLGRNKKLEVKIFYDGNEIKHWGILPSTALWDKIYNDGKGLLFSIKAALALVNRVEE